MNSSGSYNSNNITNKQDKTETLVTFRFRINPFPDEKFYTLPNSKSLQTTISNLMTMAESSPKRVENTVGKGEIARYY